MAGLEDVFKRLEGYRDEIIDLQRELTARVALGPDNGGLGEHEKANYLKERLKELAPDHLEEVRSPDNRARDGYRPNIVARWGLDIKAPAAWVLCHMDIVPPGDLSLWEGDPYMLRLEGDRLIGRGVEDNQHGIVSSYFAIKAIRESGADFNKPVGLVFVADEETGSKYGLDYLLKERGGVFKRDDLIIVPDGGNEDGTMIEVAEKSMLWIKFTVTGRQCHASTPDKGNNSLYGAARLIVALQRLKKEYNLADDLFSPPVSTFEPTKIEANVPNVNTIPGKDVFYVDCRILPSYRVEDILATVNNIVKDLEKELNLSIEVEQHYRQNAASPTPAAAPVVKALSMAIRRVRGLEAKPMGIGGGTVAAFFRQVGLPAAVWITARDTAHQPNEYCLVTDIIEDAKIFASVFLDESF